MEETGNAFLLSCPFRLLCLASGSSALIAAGLILLLT